MLAESEEDSTVVSGPVTVRAVTLAGGCCVYIVFLHVCTSEHTYV